ncbi:MAG TPA: FKBP-type peptidyl-prolyl cis-trans isomerase [Thermomonas sp.]|jgi:FKBP-type peptidyl-prolyl cis-trans isomerase|uniref:FKBP-type peptidyl-prolyl cis-trans isomerase n=1 Tax=Thermomonas sp. TaxID=1971895 RepID=UPI002C500FB0|nr:FKBP-type peptidyl-prolyl cis-trans isomerase [Thermomonas sp.]HOV95269.1 FKBP-type peptidyl-prolyl cis-trans isomerase [Thermomonas sp.]
MKPFARTTALSVAMLLALSACKAEQKPVDVSADKTEAGKAATDKTGIPGLPTEKEQVSYTIGMAMGKQLSEIKGEVNIDTVVKALRTQMAGEKVLVTDEQAQKIMQDFGQKMQAKQLAKMMEEGKTNLEKGEKFLAENAKKPGVVTTPSGLQYQVLTAGKGAKPSPTDGVKVNYKGTLLDGKEFDSSYKRGEPAVLPLNGVIPGWSEGLQLMQVGGKYKFWIPAKLAYGEQAPPMIGPNQLLEFEVELLDIVKPPAGK